jgi:hypothetical protein
MAEDYGNQKYYEHVVIRPYDAWWRDFLFLAQEVEKGGSRARIWSGFELLAAECRRSLGAGHLLGLRQTALEGNAGKAPPAAYRGN